MSNTKVKEATLPGFEGPYFPETLGRIQKRFRYEAVRWNHQFFDEVAERLHNGATSFYQRTADGYMWPVAIIFTHGEVEFKALIPGAHDLPAMRDGTNADRHCAVYSSRTVTPEELKNVSEMFTDAFVRTYRQFYEASIRDGKKKALTAASES